MSFSYREIFFGTFGLGPHACFFCEKTIEDPERWCAETLTVHHLDHDHSNDNPLNLVASHHGCHIRHHRMGVSVPPPRDPEKYSLKRSKAMKDRYSNPEERAKTAASQAASWTDERRAAFVESRLGKPHTEKRVRCVCGYESIASWVTKHQNSTGHSEKVVVSSG